MVKNALVIETCTSYNIVIFSLISHFYPSSNVSGDAMDYFSLDDKQTILETQLEVTVVPETQMEVIKTGKVGVNSIGGINLCGFCIFLSFIQGILTYIVLVC